MEAEDQEIQRTRSNENQESQPDKISNAEDSTDDDRVCGDSKGEKNDPGKKWDCSVDIKGDATDVVSRNSENMEAGRICRICHFGDESNSSQASELVELGCDCKGELGWSHQHCAEAWFWHKGDRQCEICGTTAKNIDSKSAEETSLFLMEWNELRLVAAAINDSQASSQQRCKQYFCRFLAVCLVLAFLLPWLFRGIHVL